ncbi:tRNA (guanosine(46)-N7)-methyltransferase TrmB [Candidatus Halobeggiatoa sp. HSG11]|nr:tRNA (guanosine(46)-N7)-methyltransferase TrmB [Candidatus Halobeggiatoa sp. HSG11]
MPIRSFVRRSGRVTYSQRRAMEKLWPNYGIELNGELDLSTLFGRSTEKHLEIGFGNGDALIAMAESHPEHDYIGVDVYTPGIGHLLIKIEAAQLTNVKVIQADAVEVLRNNLPSSCLDAIYLFFPDPWPKKRHHKRRLIQSNFVNLLAKRIKPGGKLHLATDWENYAQHMLAVLEAEPEFINYTNGFSQRPSERPLTKFEQRGLRLGHGIWDLLYKRC